MKEFWLWFEMGLQHIADWKGYDHILFLLVLCVPYKPEQYKILLLLITAFTIGHSLSLALGVMNILSVSSAWVEFLIPLTIVVMALGNLFGRQTNSRLSQYLLTSFFGLIHGLGFSYLLKSLLGQTEQWAFPLLYFNLGLEAGQILILAFLFMLLTLLSYIPAYTARMRSNSLSVLALIPALYLMFQRFPLAIK